MKGRVRLVQWTLAALLTLSHLSAATGLFDSVWLDAEPDIGSFYTDAGVDDAGSDDGEEIILPSLHQETRDVVSDLWQVFFPNSPAVFRSSLVLEEEEEEEENEGEEDLDINLLGENQDSGINTNRKKRQGEIPEGGTSSETIPPEYTITIDLDWSKDSGAQESTTQLQKDLASLLDIPANHVHVNPQQDGQLNFYFVKKTANVDSTDPKDLILAKDAVGALATIGLQDWDREISVEGVQAEVATETKTSYLDRFWQEPYFAIAIAAAAVIVMGLVVLLICCCMRKKNSNEKQHFPNQASALLSAVPHQICLYPAAKPSVNNATAIQPEVTGVQGNLHTDLHGDVSRIHSDVSQALGVRVGLGGTPVRVPGTPLSGSGTGSPVYSSSSQSGTPIPGTPVHTPPLRIKARGLLERRGSNASLTLELGPGTSDSSHMGSPPKESTVEEYLMAASHRMSRKELRRCLDNVKAVYSEFWEIPMNHPDKNFVPASGVKNRYRTIIPNEATRVILPEENDDILTTYINANHIRGYGGETRSFIATQGPMSNTIGDFWQMVWQEKSPIIVMITKLKEKNKHKCENYVPEIHDTFGSIDVQVEEISEKEGYIIRKLRLRSQGIEHEVLHYWYTAWPDHKAPNTARQLLTLVKEVEYQRRDQSTGQVKGPVIVHCSAGIGRTGCFIGASIGLQQLREEHAVDIQSIVCTMRLDRGGMVQTNEQYEFVHQTLMLYEEELSEEPSSGD